MPEELHSGAGSTDDLHCHFREGEQQAEESGLPWSPASNHGIGLDFSPGVLSGKIVL